MQFFKRFRVRIFAAGLAVLAAIFVFYLGLCRREETRFNRLAEELFCSEMLSNTLNMHYTLADPSAFGIKDYRPILPCYSADNIRAGQLQAEELLKKLYRLNAGKLSVEAQFTRSLLIDSLENALSPDRLPLYEEPLSPSSGMQSQLPILLAEYTFRNRRDIRDYLALLDQTDEYFASLLSFEQEKADAGLLMSASSLQKVIRQCDTVITKAELDAGTHFLQTTFEERLNSLPPDAGLTEEEKEKYAALNDRLLGTVMLPAYQTLGDGLTVLEDPRITPEGLSSKPEGKAYYEYLVRSQTGSDRPVQEIKRMVAESFDEEYRKIKSILEKSPALSDIPYDVTLTQEFPLQNASQMLTHLQSRMEKDFPPLSGDEPLPTVTLKTLSASLEDYCAPAFYLTPPLDDTSSNAIYINGKNSPAGLELYTTLAHEGYPGHMYQSVYHNRDLMRTSPDLTAAVRELLWHGGYLEGWALYVEYLSYDYASEMYREKGSEILADAVQLCRHNNSLLLSLYSFLDIIIHYENAPLSQVCAILKHFGITDQSAIAAVYEYIVEEPANYLKYYLGYLEILSLKEQAKSLWENSYTDYGFHTFLLESGPADFSLLQEALKAWPSPKLTDGSRAQGR